jgi:hypothetical protein
MLQKGRAISMPGLAEVIGAFRGPPALEVCGAVIVGYSPA